MAIQFFLLEAAAQGAVTSNIRTVPSPMSCTILEIGVRCGSPNASGAAIFDVNKNSASIFADPSNRPSIAAGQTSGERTGLNVALAKDDLLSVDVDAVPLGGVAGPVFIRIKVDDGTAVQGEQGEPGEPGEPGEGVPAGGTSGQILAKNSNTDFDTGWIDAPGGDGGGALAGDVAGDAGANVLTSFAGFPVDPGILDGSVEVGEGQVLMLVDSVWQARTIAPTVVSGEAEQDIAWAGLTGSASVDGSNTLQTTTDWSGSGAHQGAHATQTLNGVGGHVTVGVHGSTESTRYIFLRNTTPDHSWQTAGVAIVAQIRGDGHIRIADFASGQTLSSGYTDATYADGDTLTFEAYDAAGVPKLRFLQNGTLVVNFDLTPVFPYRFDVELPFFGLHIIGGRIQRAAA